MRTKTTITNRNTFLAVAVDVAISMVRFSNAPVAILVNVAVSARAVTNSMKVAVPTSVGNTVLKSAEPVISAKDSMWPANRVKQGVAAGPAKKVADAAAAEAAEEDS